MPNIQKESYCIKCDSIHPYSSFFDSLGNKKRYCAECRKKAQNAWRKSHPFEKQKFISKNRGLGFKPLNNHFPNSHIHHLHIEKSKEYAIFIPKWLHYLNPHNVKTWVGMDSINATALDFWVNESLYISLFEIENGEISRFKENAISWGKFIDEIKKEEIEAF